MPEGRVQGWVFWEEDSQPPPDQLGGVGSVVSSPAGPGAEPRPPSGFTTFEVLRKTSPDS